MTNQQRKHFIISAIERAECSDVHDALRVAGEEIECLEAIPFGSRNEIIRICEDIADGVIDGSESIKRLLEFVNSVPD
ncbi:hypothetical protein C3B51_00080 [Pseudoalteromonas rubra]|uniref:Uncharacterized protein n=1 Tax=Pseudoalteromonas rubra TaxID=43658 RepID=A0A4Q7ENB0_9GAMM|nr:hypothetical protein [Pseudoalteromonas rubra]RZM85371.1 hypothetical protein C3B51_00080 [Pseudoalteromonas rubra]